MTRVVELGDTSGGGILGEYGVVLRLRSGDYLAVAGPASNELSVFDSAGVFRRIVGRPGNGPGEYRAIRVLAHTTSGFAIFDDHNARVTVLDDSFDVIGEYPSRGQTSNAAALNDSTFILNSLIRTQQEIGIPLHLLNGNDGIIASFGEEGVDWSGRRAVTVAPDGTIWSVVADSYVVDHHTATGELLGTFQRKPAWFQPPPQPAGPNEAPPPSPMAWAAQIDSAGLLWVLSSVADRNWRDGITQMPNGDWAFFDNSKYLDTMIEVLDTRTGELVADLQLDENLEGFADLRNAYSLQSPGDVPGFVVWRLALDRGLLSRSN